MFLFLLFSVFVMGWFLVFFMLLPWGTHVQEAWDGGGSGAPQIAQLGLKAWLAAVVSAAFTGVLGFVLGF
jgi:predicted secreted protein